jgi:hypothetical protein
VEFTVGQEVWVLLSSNATSRGAGPQWRRATITKVGRKFVYIERRYGKPVKFDEDGRQVTTYPGNAESIYTDEGKARFEHKAETYRRLSTLNVSFGFGPPKFSLEALAAVADLLEQAQAEQVDPTLDGGWPA